MELESNCNTGRHGNRKSSKDDHSSTNAPHVEGKDKRRRFLSKSSSSSSSHNETAADDVVSQGGNGNGGVWKKISGIGQATGSFFSKCYDYLSSLASKSPPPPTESPTPTSNERVQKDPPVSQPETEKKRSGLVSHSAITADDAMEATKNTSLGEAEKKSSNKIVDISNESRNLRHKAKAPLASDKASNGISENQPDSRQQSLREAVPVESADPVQDGWEFVVEQDKCKVYSKFYKETGLKQYKVIGSYDDITPRDFLDVQVSNGVREGEILPSCFIYLLSLLVMKKERHGMPMSLNLIQ